MFGGAAGSICCRSQNYSTLQGSMNLTDFDAATLRVKYEQSLVGTCNGAADRFWSSNA